MIRVPHRLQSTKKVHERVLVSAYIYVGRGKDSNFDESCDIGFVGVVYPVSCRAACSVLSDRHVLYNLTEQCKGPKM